MLVARYSKKQIPDLIPLKNKQKGKIMETKKIKTLPIKETIHTQIAECARERGMTIQGLSERIFRAWLDENFFASNVASSNKGNISASKNGATA